ncbi:hypothetical protein LTR08_007541 [Meristemomyces frigidus]|nr:hypothetical protein LTR08_007541 [Meristemomyces frigidus]
MVYRGKPSAGCDSCRKSKKRCTLELPACARCVKLNKQCSGYRDTTQLQIYDETEAVQLKAERQQARHAAASSKSAPPSKPTAPTRAQIPEGVLNAASPSTDSSSSSDENNDILLHNPVTDLSFGPPCSVGAYGSSYGFISTSGPLTMTMRTTADDIAMTHFFNRFTSARDWEFLRGYAGRAHLDPCLELAIRACGMAALDNVEELVMGRDYAQSMYVEALGLLNSALRDPKRCRTDESLIAVAMLGYYENLTCHSKESVTSWKAHVTGATQLLKLRGKQQLKSDAGRTLFRLTRAQILIQCIWGDVAPQSFLWDWEDELERQTVNHHLVKPADDLACLCYDFACARASMRTKTISDVEAATLCSDLDCRMIQWSIDAMNGDELWRYREIDVQDSPHVWNGTVHAYTQQPAPSVWNTYRGVRILLTRCQEDLCRRFGFTDAEREEQLGYFRRIRRQMTDEICAAVPAQLGHASPAYTSPCVLISAYSSIWPLFFAGNCALERVGSAAWVQMQNGSAQTSAAFAQTAWIIGRLEYISKYVGMRFAGGIADVLKGDFTIADDLLVD